MTIENVWFGFDFLVESVVVVGDVVVDLAVEVGAGFGGNQIEVVLFDGSPETLNPDIVRGTAFTVHRDFNILILKKRSPSE